MRAMCPRANDIIEHGGERCTTRLEQVTLRFILADRAAGCQPVTSFASHLAASPAPRAGVSALCVRASARTYVRAKASGSFGCASAAIAGLGACREGYGRAPEFRLEAGLALAPEEQSHPSTSAVSHSASCWCPEDASSSSPNASMSRLAAACWAEREAVSQGCALRGPFRLLALGEDCFEGADGEGEEVDLLIQQLQDVVVDGVAQGEVVDTDFAHLA